MNAVLVCVEDGRILAKEKELVEVLMRLRFREAPKPEYRHLVSFLEMNYAELYRQVHGFPPPVSPTKKRNVFIKRVRAKLTVLAAMQ